MNEAPENQEEMDLNFHTDIPVGEILRRTRSHYGQSLYQIEQTLRIRASQLEALEKGEIHKLPGRVYAIGFVRSYSEYLGLDGDKMVYLFKEQSVGRKQARPEIRYPVAASESKTPNLSIIAASIAGALLLIGFISFLIYPESPQNEVPHVPDALLGSQLTQAPALVESQSRNRPADNAAAPPQPQPSQNALAPSAGAPQNAPAAANSAVTAAAAQGRIVFEVTDASWVEIRNRQGTAILRQVLKPGDVYYVPDEEGLVMTTGNAGGMRVLVDGQAIAPLGEPAAVRRNIRLDPEILLKAGTRNAG